MPQTTDPQELHNFEQTAQMWWEAEGPFKLLHQLNPVRVQYICERCQHYLGLSADLLLKDLEILDVGCGGGLVAEALAKLGAHVTGIDAGPETITIAQRHAAQQQLEIDYRCGEVSTLLTETKRFNVIIALEIVEHVTDVAFFIQTLAQLLQPKGLLILSTLNRTPLSYMLGVVAAEYILNWIPKGTHQWRRFLKPHELAHHLRKAGLTIKEINGLTFNPCTGHWSLSTNLSINYFMVAQYE
jgi:2-polyprenyl-6-hydroxyphenyl methylase/3-demethylubiquinone-9 3-methyltransferase